MARVPAYSRETGLRTELFPKYMYGVERMKGIINPPNKYLPPQFTNWPMPPIGIWWAELILFAQVELLQKSGQQGSSGG